MFKESQPYEMFFKMNYNDTDYKSINLVQKGIKRKLTSDSSNIPCKLRKAYHTMLPISQEKYNDLMWMCDHQMIEQRQHNYFESIPVSS